MRQRGKRGETGPGGHSEGRVWRERGQRGGRHFGFGRSRERLERESGSMRNAAASVRLFTRE